MHNSRVFASLRNCHGSEAHLASVVTVPGGTGVTIAIPYSSAADAAAAQALLSVLYDTDPTIVNPVWAGQQFAGANPYDVNEFIDALSGQWQVPTGFQYVIDDYATAASGLYPVDSFVGHGNFNGAVIDASNTSLAFEAGTGMVSVVAGGAITFTTEAALSPGGAVTLDGADMESVDLASGSWTFLTGVDSSGTVTLGAGTSMVTVQGAQTVYGGSGPATVTLDHSQSVYQGGPGTATVVDNYVNDTIRGGAGRETVFAQGSGLQVFGTSAEVLFVDITGHNRLSAGSGGAVVFGSGIGSYYQTGGAYFIFSSGGGADTIAAGAADVAPVVFGSPDARIYIQSEAEGPFAVAGSGNETIDAAQSQVGTVYFAGTGSDNLIGGQGSDFFCASSGNATMQGGIGNVYEFIDHHAGGRDVITNFTPYDELYLVSFGTSAGDGIATEIVISGTLDLTLTDGTSIAFQNLSSPSQLSGHIHNI